MRPFFRASLLTAIAAAIFGCKPRDEPAQHAWTTYWDPRGVALTGEGPSHAHSSYWANAKEKESLKTSNTAIPIDITCRSDGPPAITVSLAAFSSTEKDIPLGVGMYPIVGKQSGTVKAGQVLAGALMYNKSMYDATGGTLKLDRFDKSGVKGSFTITGTELLTGAKPIQIEGTFEIPCRGGILESECKVNKSVARE
jgi:hypothetical protein